MIRTTALLIFLLLVSVPDANIKDITIATNPEFKSDSTAFYGVKLMQQGCFLHGLSLLDSLRTTGKNDRSFIQSYASEVLKSCMKDTASQQNKLLAQSFIYAIPDTLAKSGSSWQTTMSIKQKLPNYSYRASFAFTKQFKLIFTGLHAPNDFLLKGVQVKPWEKNSENQLAAQIFNRADSVRCDIFIDFDTVRCALFDYISHRISGLYDSVAVKDDFTGMKALSLRGFNRYRYSGEDKYTAIASFDKPIRNLANTDTLSKSKNRLSTINARLTIVVCAPREAQDIAEVKFASIVRMF